MATTSDHDPIADVSSTDVLTADPQQADPEPVAIQLRPVHPLAASFPMLEGEELDALVDDIRTNGLLHSIVLDLSGQVIDGRNRLKACALANVEPKFSTHEGDPIAYIVGANVHRRHLSKGQQAMAFAKAYPEATAKGGRGKTAVLDTGVSGEYITKARFVLKHAPGLAAKVMAGSSLPEAYNLAAEQKREQEEYERRRTEVRDTLDSIVTICLRSKSDTDKPATAFLDQGEWLRAVRSDLHEIIQCAKQLADTI